MRTNERADLQVRDVNAYTEADRPLLERVWQQFYAPLTLDNEVIS